MIAARRAFVEEFDLVVVGAGSGGVRAARLAAQSGARVAVVESSDLGGTCVNLGCVPKKLFSYAAGYSEAFADAAGFGWELGEPGFTWERLRENKNAEIRRLNGIYGSLLDGAGATLVRGRASLAQGEGGRGAVRVGERTLQAGKVLLAVGGEPARPAIDGIDLAWVSDDIFHLPQLPQSILILGGGYIAVEFASILAGLGLEVTLAYRGPLFLRGFDHSLRERLRDALGHQGVRLLFGHAPQAIEAAPGQDGGGGKAGKAGKDGGGRLVRFANGEQVRADAVLQALGRVPRTQGLGLQELGVRMGGDAGGDDRAVRADDSYATSLPWLYALGDVLGGPQLTPYAIAQAVDFCAQHFPQGAPSAAPRGRRTVIPTAVFTHPQIGTVGATEGQAAQQGPTWVYESSFRHLRDTLSGRGSPVYLKLVVAQDPQGPVVGAHMVGDDAAEIVQALAIAVTNGLTKAQWDATLPVHPTVAEEFVTLREARPGRPDPDG